LNSNSNRITSTRDSSHHHSTLFHPRPPQTPPIDSEPLSPLHQSPSLPATMTMSDNWSLPPPPESDDIALRLNARSMYLLGEGRYATVFLASYKKEQRSGGRRKERRTDNPNPFAGYGHSARSARDHGPAGNSIASTIPSEGGGEQGATSNSEMGTGLEMEVNQDGNGYTNGSWRLCAAKRMAPDRQSQTMGLREAFFLNRLSSTAAITPSSTRPARLDPGLPGVGMAGRRDIRSRAVSPLRDGFPRRSSSAVNPSNEKKRENGHVYVIKLIAVKEDTPPRTTTTSSGSGSGHARSVSDAVQEGSRGLVRQRSSTMMNRSRDEKLDNDQPINTLNSFPSLPSLAKAAKAEIETAPALSRLVLVLEHAPLGTMDRFLRTSPDLVGKRLWQRWAVQTTDALHWVHGKGIVHADIKAGNLLVSPALLHPNLAFRC
jgi:serine/threonine protein kinase